MQSTPAMPLHNAFPPPPPNKATRPRSECVVFLQLSVTLLVCVLRIAFASHLNRQRQTIGRTLAHTQHICISVTCTFDCDCSCCLCLCPAAWRWSFYSPLSLSLSLDSFFTWHFSTFPFAIVISAFVRGVCVRGGGRVLTGWWVIACPKHFAFLLLI